jgi:hypothetical protein
VVNWADEELLISKTVETYYEREHFWDIDKWVETDYGHTIEDDIPKIWLWEDGSGDEWADWYVCVTYLGYEDNSFNVAGFVTIDNIGATDAVILSVEDLLCGAPIAVDFGVTFPYVLPAGDSLIGTYYEDVAGPIDCVNEVIVTTEMDVYGTIEPVTWGDPDEVELDVVDIQDISDLFGLQDLGTLYAVDYTPGDVECFTYDMYFAWTDYVAPGPYTYENTATIVQTGQSADAILVVNWEVPGDEGCTPGFWKNNAINWDASAWMCYDPDDLFEDVFGVDVTLRGKGKSTIEDPTLLEALGANGGGINALARHAVAALLNICSTDIAYAGSMSEAGLIAAVQDAIAAGEDAIEALHTDLADYNEAGCPVNQHGERINGIIG